MTNWELEHIDADTMFGNEFVLRIDGTEHRLTEREADTIMGVLSICGAKNPNQGRYNPATRDGDSS